MPLDVLGRTRATMCRAESLPIREDRATREIGSRLGLRAESALTNLEFLVCADHHLALIKSLPFVHTARRYY